MTAPSPTSTDKPDSSPPGSNAGSTEEKTTMESAETESSDKEGTPEQSAKREGDAASNEIGDEGAARPTESAASAESMQPRDLWVDELHSLTVLELHERFAELKLRANPEKT